MQENTIFWKQPTLQASLPIGVFSIAGQSCSIETFLAHFLSISLMHQNMVQHYYSVFYLWATGISLRQTRFWRSKVCYQLTGRSKGACIKDFFANGPRQLRIVHTRDNFLFFVPNKAMFEGHFWLDLQISFLCICSAQEVTLQPGNQRCI